MTARLSRALIIGLAVLTSTAFIACGDDDSAEPESTTGGEPALDATAFRECIYSSDYKQTDSPEPELAELAETSEAEYIEAIRATDGLVVFYVFDDAAAAGDFESEFEATLADVTKRLPEDANGKPLTSAVGTHDSIVFGVVPFDSGEEGQLSEAVASDVSTCTEEQNSTS